MLINQQHAASQNENHTSHADNNKTPVLISSKQPLDLYSQGLDFQKSQLILRRSAKSSFTGFAAGCTCPRARKPVGRSEEGSADAPPRCPDYDADPMAAPSRCPDYAADPMAAKFSTFGERCSTQSLKRQRRGRTAPRPRTPRASPHSSSLQSTFSAGLSDC